jgi:signal transduction histidine kinase
VIAFAYVALTIIVALAIPLTLTLNRRARAEFERENIIRATTIAQDVGAENLAPSQREALRAIVHNAGGQVDGRVIVVDAAGNLVADSVGPATGASYATPGRPEIDAALTGQPTSVIRSSQDLGATIMATAVPIVDETRGGPPAVVGAVRITQSMEVVDQNVRRVTLGILAIGMGGLAAGLILAVALSGSLARPLRRLADTAQRFGSSDLSVRAGAMDGPVEVVQVARSFDQMADRVETTVRAHEEFVANASHQLRTPLTSMKLRLEAAIAEERDQAVRVELEEANREVDRLSAIVTRLLAMADETEQAPPVIADLLDLAERAADGWRQAALGSTITVTGAPSQARVHPSDVLQILDDLFDNARIHAPGPVEVEAGHDRNHAWLAVRDHGPGMSEETRARATERFYRAPGSVRGGSGLGLAIARQLAEHDAGTITIEPGERDGVRVEVRYPSANFAEA